MNFRPHQPGLDLGGEWTVAFSNTPPENEIRDIASLETSGLTLYPATVPGNFELDLQANGLIDEPFYGMNIAVLTRYEGCHVWYARRFRADPPPDCETHLLFEGLDYSGTMWLNGSDEQTFWANMLVEQRLPVDLQEENELVVHFNPAAEAGDLWAHSPSLFTQSNRYQSLRVRKAAHMYGWDIMPRAVSAGIWRPVRLLYLPRERLEWVYLETLAVAPDHDSAHLTLHFDSRLAEPCLGDAIYEIEVEGCCGNTVFHARERMLSRGGRMWVHVPSPRLWWPRGRGEANLYDVQARLLKDGEELDRMEFTHGIRTVELERTSVTDEEGHGEFCFRVNGEKVFMLGSNWVPVDAYHSRDAQRIPAILDMADELGCNMLRCWGGNVYENNLFYDLCDRKGILVWQDFSMACAVYPQDNSFQHTLRWEVRQVVQRLRQHACLALWAGDNECDQAWSWSGRPQDPNQNVLTRRVIPDVLREQDPGRPYLPSSPYIDPEAFERGERYLPENHLWGPRDYYKSAYYTGSLCHFASEIGYHGCPAPESIRKFISPEKLWPYQDNEEWLLHSTSPIPGVDLYDYRVELMAKQVRELFGEVPDNLADFAFASQASQAEALKFFIELFRGQKWRRTGILWWNLMDGWPQFSDAIVDYYFERKLAYEFVRRAQGPLCLVLREPQNWGQDLVACNDTRDDLTLAYTVRDVDNREILARGEAVARADAVTILGRIPFSAAWKRFYLMEWKSLAGDGRSHYLAGYPPFELEHYRQWLAKAGLYKD